jgi:hypothetical protein
MHKKGFVIGVVVGIGLAVAVGSVEAKEKPFHANFAGTSTNKDDFSFTGTPAAGFYNTVAGKSTLSQYTAQLVGEAAPDGNTCTLTGSGSGMELVTVGEAVVLSFAATGEQLFLNLSSSVTSHACCGPTTCNGQTTFDVSGGTGRFAGATGTIVKTWKTIGLAPPPPGIGGFSSFTGTFDGTIELAQ